MTDREARADDFVNYKRVEPGDVVINRMRAFEGGAGISAFRGIVSSDYAVLRTRDALDARFLHHLIRSRWFVGEMTARLRGIGNAELGNVRTPRINVEDLGNILVSLPPADEQRAIADHLDAETARLDALIDALKAANELLKQRLSASIESIVWGHADEEIPLMHLTQDERQIQYGIVLPGPDVDEGIPIVKGGNLLTGVLRAEGLAKTTRDIEAGYARSRLRADDLAFAIRGAVGACALVPREVEGANITQDVAMVAPRRGVDTTWLLYVLRSPSVQAQAEARVVGATIRGLNIRDLKRLKAPMIELRSQLEQAQELRRLQVQHDSLTRARARQVELLLERRQAVITAAVTGQIELPEVAA
jgi:type I restriction enzyme, S subunit